MKNLIIALIVTLVSSAAYAEGEFSAFDNWFTKKDGTNYNIRLQLGGWSNHIGVADGVFNETHHMIGVSYHDYFVATFKNSFGEQTHAVGYEFNGTPIKALPNLQMGVMMGAHYGYRACFIAEMGKSYYEGNQKVCPLIAPVVRLTGVRVEPTFMLLANAAVVSFAIDF